MAAERDRGAQTVDRAIAVLRALASAGSGGIRLTDLQLATGLSKQTVHRILTSLIRHGFAEQGTAREYRVGREMAMLAWSTVGYEQHLRQLCEPDLEALAEKTGDTVFLMIRSGLDTVCVDVKTGHFPIKAMPVKVGTRRPLGIGASGIMLLACLPPAEAERAQIHLKANVGSFPRSSLRDLERAVREARRKGYAFSEGFVTEGINALAVPVLDRAGNAIGAIAVAAIRDRLKPARASTLTEWLRQSKRSVERKLQASA